MATIGKLKLNPLQKTIAAPSKAEGGEKDVDLSCDYSRGEGRPTRKWPLSRVFVGFYRPCVRSGHSSEVWEFFWKSRHSRRNPVA